MSKRDEYIDKMKQQLDALNAQLKELESKGETAQTEFLEKHSDQITQMREHYVAGLAKLDQVKSASEDKWESLVTDGEKIYKAFVHSFNYFKSQLK